MGRREADGLVDLHVHTTYSDGLMAPGEVVVTARSLGLRAVAITDHDSVSGIDEAMERGKALGVEVVPGVEMSTGVSGEDVHILGYLLDWRAEEVQQRFHDLRRKRDERAQRMVEKLAELDVSVTIERVRELAGDGAVGRPHLAQAMLEAGAVRSINEAFDRYIGYDKPAYVPKSKLSPLEAVEFIHAQHGVAVIAHPATYGNDSVVYAAIAAGVDGIEVWHSDHDKRAVAHYQEVAQKNGLIATGGSDCHGGRKNNMVYLGQVEVPYQCLEELRRVQRKYLK
ncbi:MAG: PHP domain-containing protein [candidate division WOR-3 bacterium]